MVLASPASYFTVSPKTGCELSPAYLDALLLFTSSREAIAKAGVAAEVREEDLKYAIEGGTCVDDGEARGQVTLVVSWMRVVVVRDLPHVTNQTKSERRIVGKLGEHGFEGPTVTYMRTAKVSELGDWVYAMSYTNFASSIPVHVFASKAVSFGFDAKGLMHFSTLGEPLPDGRIKLTSWSGRRKESEQHMRPDGTLHGAVRTFPQRVGEVDVPGMDLCYVDGKIAPRGCP